MNGYIVWPSGDFDGNAVIIEAETEEKAVEEYLNEN